MDTVLIIAIGIVVVVVTSVIAQKIKVSAPLVLVVIGAAFSLLPFTDPRQVSGEFVLYVILPPILYASAISVPIIDFRRSFGAIFGLSVLLVFASAFAIAFLIHAVFPPISFASALALGAVLAPTDAVAATSIGKKLGLPSRLVTILEGESLVNDATALALMRTATAAIALGTAGIDFGSAVGTFGYGAGVGILIGLLVGIVSVFFRSKLTNPIHDSAISLIMPFVAFLPAEELHASGVVSVVVCGLYAGTMSGKRFSPEARFQERTNWHTVQFLLENGVFLIMGLEIDPLVKDVVGGKVGLSPVIGLAAIAIAALVVLRFIFVIVLVFATRNSMRHREQRHAQWDEMMAKLRQMPDMPKRTSKRMAHFERNYARVTANLESLRREGFGFRGAAVIGWSGMRGVVTLAAAQTLPLDTPYRAELILIAFIVAAFTLLAQGSTLPLIIRLVKINGGDKAAERMAFKHLAKELNAAGIEAIDRGELTLPSGRKPDAEVLSQLRRSRVQKAEMLDSRTEKSLVGDPEDNPVFQFRVLRDQMIQVERQALLEAKSLGKYPSNIIQNAELQLDRQELQTKMPN